MSLQQYLGREIKPANKIPFAVIVIIDFFSLLLAALMVKL